MTPFFRSEHQSAIQRVHAKDWGRPVCGEWVAALETAFEHSGPNTVLVAHSLACLQLAHWAAGTGTNPEQLFAAGYSACFIGAMKVAAGAQKIALPDNLSITADVGLGPIPGGFGIQVALAISVPGLERDKAEAVVAAAHKICPYSNATRGNVDVTLKVV